eukprot:gene1379-1521_t
MLLGFVYLGNVLDNERTLLSYGVNDGSTIYVFKRPPLCDPSRNVDEPVKPAQLAELLQKAGNNTVYQTSVKKYLSDPNNVEQLVIAIPELKRDPVGLALLKDPELLFQMAETANIERVVKEHPALAKAAAHIMATISKEIKSERQMSTSNNTGMQEANDIEGMDPSSVIVITAYCKGRNDCRTRRAIQDVKQQDHSKYLPCNLPWLCHKQESIPQPSTSRYNNPQCSNPQHSLKLVHQGSFSLPSSAITSDFFSQAIASAIAATSRVSPEQQQQHIAQREPQGAQHASSTSHQAALQQMRDMGITNDSLSLQALAQTGGNVQAALNLLFEDGVE